MEYSIRQLAEMAGVSARTLRYYDQIGLLKPLYTTDAGYRYYGAEEVEKLQQILFYKERGLRLDEIQAILSQEDFDVMTALTEHLEELKKEEMRIAGLISTVKKTIASMKGETDMEDNEKFEAFKKKMAADNDMAYGEEIRRKYGEDAVEASNRKLLAMSEEDYSMFKELEEEIKSTLESAVSQGETPDSESGKKAAELHQRWIQMTWNTYSKEAHKGVAAMYVEDERFKRYYDSRVEGCAEFLKQAVQIWI